MSRRQTTTEMVAKSKTNILSTPDHTFDSPSRDSDSMYDSETASPVPFLCTQDGAEGTADVVWNYYGTSSKTSHPKNSTPVSKKSRKSHRLKFPEKKPQATQHRRTRVTQKKTQLTMELMELNNYVDKLMEEKSKTSGIAEKPKPGSEEDIFADAPDHSPKSIFRTKKCLRKNVLSSKFSKPESETGLESDDSLNECLLITSQAVEEKLLTNKPVPLDFDVQPVSDLNINDDSMDAIFRNVKSPYINKLKCESPGLKNDSFDSLLGNLNDSALEQLSHMPVLDRRKSTDKSKLNDTSWKEAEVEHNDSPSSRISFTRHSSMPESPSIPNRITSTHGNALSLGRYNSMPFNDRKEKHAGDSPIRCTPLEIQRKRQQAREKLLAKRLLPFTQTQQPCVEMPSQSNALKSWKFEPKVPTVNHPKTDNNQKSETCFVDLHSQSNATKNCKFEWKVPKRSLPKDVTIQKSEPCLLKQNVTDNSNASVNIQSLIEKKRQEALMKLRRKQLQK